MPVLRHPNAFRLRPASLLAVVGVIFIGTFAVSHHAAAANIVTDVVGGLANAIFEILNYILLGIIKLFALLTSVFVGLLVAVAQYNVFLNAPVVTAGWPIVRDLMNMVFIIALLIIAAGTVLRIENYRYNRLLGRLIIMALLVNFSNVITVFFIQFAQIVMLTFVNAFKDIAFGNFVHAFGLDKVLIFSDNPGTESSQLAIFISLLAGLIMMIVAFIVTLALAVILFVRIIALWILIILSPMAYALRVLPNTEKYASQWWQEFGRYVTVGPVIAFFLWLALAIVSNQAINQRNCSDPFSCGDEKFAEIIKEQQNNSSSGMQKLLSGFATEILNLSQIMTFLVAIIFLMLGLKYAQSSGVAGGNFAAKFATGAVLTGTGIAALRDRTWEPMKGWVRNRQAARKAAIEERTQTLEAAGDRGRARFGAETGIGRALGRAPLIGRGFQRGTEKAGAAAREYERQRTAQYARERGLKDWRPEDIEREMLTATDPRRRLAMMQELQNRGRLDLSNEAHDSAFETVTRQLRLPEGERNKMREDILKSSAAHMSEADVRRKLNVVQRPEELLILYQDLEKKNALQGDKAYDQELAARVQDSLRAMPEKRRQFEADMMKSNWRLAMPVLFHNLKETDPAAQRSRITDYKNALAQKLISTASMTKELEQELVSRGPEGQNLAAELVNHLHEISPDEETFRSFWKGMSDESARVWSKHIDMAGEQSIDRRGMVAKVTGQWGKTFRDKSGAWLTEARKNEETGVMETVAVAQDYFEKIGGAELSKSLADEAVEDLDVLSMMKKSDNFVFRNWEDVRTRRKESRDALGRGLEKLIASLPRDKDDKTKVSMESTDYAGTEEEQKKKLAEAQFFAQQSFLAKKGKVNPYNIASAKGLAEFEHTLIGAGATDISSLDKSDEYKNPALAAAIQRAVGINADLSELKNLYLMNASFAADSIKAAEEELKKQIAAGSKRAQNRLRSMARHPVLGKFVEYPGYERNE